MKEIIALLTLDRVGKTLFKTNYSIHFVSITTYRNKLSPASDASFTRIKITQNDSGHYCLATENYIGGHGA